MSMRHYKRRRGKMYKSSVMHIPSSMNAVLASNTATVFFASQTANYTTTGTLLTSDTFEQSDRSQTTALGSDINFIVYNLSCIAGETASIIEYAIFKIERSNSVPSFDNSTLPASTTIQTQGLQSGMRQYQPGRVLKFGKFVIAAEQPRAISLGISYRKFKMAKVRTGDFYGIVVFNRGSSDVTLDIEARYNAKV